MAKICCNNGFIASMVCCDDSSLMVHCVDGYVAFNGYVVNEGSLWRRFIVMVLLHQWFVVAIVH